MPEARERPARARSAEEKHQRRDDILRAAERLWTTIPYADLSMNQVAREANLAKGTLYLYFGTKEELFLALLTEHLHAWLHALSDHLQNNPPRTPDEVAEALLFAPHDLEPLRRLLVLLGNVLERNLRPELTLQFKKDLSHLTQGVVAHLPYPELVTLRLMRHLYALSIGWQQLTEISPVSEQAPQDPVFSVARSFDTEYALGVRAMVHALTPHS